MNQEIKVTDTMFTDYYRQLVPFGYMDVNSAISTSLDAGKDADWAAEQVAEYMESTEVTIDKVDPVACVWESLLQEFRNEIEELTKFDLCNDSNTKKPLYVAGNFMCTSFDYSEDFISELTAILDKAGVIISDLSECAQWVLSQIEITQLMING